MRTILLALLTAASAATFLRADLLDSSIQAYIFKPLTIAFVILNVALARRPVSVHYKTLVLAGLILSLVGDTLLILPTDQFLLGLVAFLLAHIFYIAAFRSGVRIPFSPMSTIPFALYGVGAYAILRSGLGQMALPVAGYVTVILVMAWQAYGRWRSTGRRGDLLAFVGAVFFVISDTALAISRFRFPFEASGAVVWTTYVAAQWLISQSVLGGPASGAEDATQPAGS